MPHFALPRPQHGGRAPAKPRMWCLLLESRAGWGWGRAWGQRGSGTSSGPGVGATGRAQTHGSPSGSRS